MSILMTVVRSMILLPQHQTVLIENVHHTKFSNNNCNQHSFPQANQEAEHDFDFVEVNDKDGRDNNINDIDEQPLINFAHGILPINGMNYNNCQSCGFFIVRS